MLIHLVIFIFAGDDITLMMTDSQRKNAGWVVVGLCSTFVAYNAIFVFTEQVFTFWNLIKLMARAICKKKKPESNKQRKKSTLRHRERKRYRDAFINRLERNLEDSSRDDSRILQNKSRSINLQGVRPIRNIKHHAEKG